MDGSTVSKLLDDKVKIVKYSKLKNFKNIEEALHPHNKFITLYETKRNYGHWVCFWKNNKGEIHFFDSYGEKPDDQFRYIPIDFRKMTYGDGLSTKAYPQLTKFLYDYANKTNNDIRYNEFPFQSKNTSTCGKWCILRLTYPNLTEYEFKAFVDLLKEKYEKSLNKKIKYDDMFDLKKVTPTLI